MKIFTQIDVKEKKGSDEWVVVKQMSDAPIYPPQSPGEVSGNYYGHTEVSYKYNLTPGQYILQPSTFAVVANARSFCIRTLSSVPHSCEYDFHTFVYL